MLPSFLGLCVCFDPEKSFSCSVEGWGQVVGGGVVANSSSQGQHHFLMDTKTLHKIAEALPKYTNNPGECSRRLKEFF